MNKFNQLGVELLEYKKELVKDYPELVLKSLYSSIDSMATDGIIDVDIHYALKDKSQDIESLKTLLLSKKTCLKTKEQLLEEYEELRDKLDKALSLADNDYVSTKSDIDNEAIVLTQKFVLKEDFLKNYFYIESEKDFETLMKRKGFIEKFAILRLEKIFNDFLNNINSNELYKVDHSKVFFNGEENLYGIQLLVNIPVENLEVDENISEMSMEIGSLISFSSDYYESKISN